MRQPLALLLLLLVAAASPAAAQGLGGEVTARFQPDALTLSVGDAGAADLVVVNGKLQPVTVTVYAANDRGLVLTLSKTSLVLAPGAQDTVRVDLYPAASLGPTTMTARVWLSDGTPLAGGRNWTEDLPLAITADAPHPAAARVSPAGFPDARAAPGENATLFGNVTHASASAQSYAVRTLLPQGWTAATDSPLVVQPGAATPLRMTVTPAADAVDGPARILLEGGNGTSAPRVADVWLAKGNATPPPRNETPPRSNETRNATENGTADPPRSNGTAPPAANETTTDPPKDDDAPAENGTADPPAPTPSEPEPATTPGDPGPPPRLLLEVTPGVVPIAPGGTAQATLRATSDKDLDLVVRLTLPQGLGSDLTQRTLLLSAGIAFEVPFLLEADAGLENGTRLAATVATEDGAASATFEVLVVVPDPPVELTSVPTPPPPTTGDQGTTRGLALAAVAASVGGAALALLWTRKKWALALAGLYARLRPQAVLQHPARQRMMEIVRARPGLTLRDLQREVGLANGATTHHVRTLEKAGMLRIVEDGMLRRIYPVGHARVDPVPALSERILKAVEARGEATPADIAAAVGATRQAVHYHVQKMVRDGTLRARIEGRETYLRLMPASPAPLPRQAGT